MSPRQMRLVVWLIAACAVLNWIVFAKALDWWQLVLAILLTVSAVVWAVRLKRAAAT